MSRIARIVVPGCPHHITQRGNRRQRTFFCDADYKLYIYLMAEWCARYSVEIWAYCLMPNHTHLIAVPKDETGMRLAIGEAHRRYTLYINFREGWRGHLWQERFSSFPMEEHHLLAAAKYIELNPVAAGIVKTAGEYLWSSARAHLSGVPDGLAGGSVLEEIAGDWKKFLGEPVDPHEADSIKTHSSTGRPFGGQEFIEKLELDLGRNLQKGRPGRRKGSHLSI